LTLVAREVLPANFLAGATAADPFDGLSTSVVTITAGTNS